MSDIKLRTHRIGDAGYIIHRHGIVYSEQYGWDMRFEAYVARIMADFIENYNEATDRSWIAEKDGEFLGCVLVCKDGELQDTARLRLLMVEPGARGMGLGTKLTKACVDFAREKGYRRMVLSTQSLLAPALRLYEAAGFRRVAAEDVFAPGNSQGEYWELEL